MVFITLVIVFSKGSWEKKIIDRVHNMRAASKRLANDDAGSSPSKRGRPKGSLLQRHYPPLNIDADFSDTSTNERNLKVLSKELERDTPRKDIILSLMKSTFGVRQEEILLDSDVSVGVILEKHPSLHLPYVVRYSSNICFQFL